MKKVVASREGLIGGLTAAGLTIRENSLFCALPSRRALWRTVRIVRRPNATTLRSVVCPVLDVGPWFPFREYGDDDAYVFGDQRPRAESMRGMPRAGDPRALAINGAAIDLSDAAIEALGFRPEEWGLREVEWEFVE